MLSLVTLWWLLFWTALGLCLGSFLNAVIYRLPRAGSLRNPLWSFCPCCNHPIRWHDNIPILSFLLLRGRCRHCGIPIATRYLVIEASMALIVLMLLDAFFIAGVRSGLSHPAGGLTEALINDWPIFVAHIILFACLLPMSVIDLEYYWVDVRFTNLATLAGFFLHTIWTPKHSDRWIRPFDTTAVMCLAALVGLGIAWVWLVCWYSLKEASSEDGDELEMADHAAADRLDEEPPPSLVSPSRAAGYIAVALLAVTLILLWLDETGTVDLRHAGRALLPLVLFFGLIVWESSGSRPADEEIVEAIHRERHGARRTALTELGFLILPLLLAAGAGWFMLRYPDASTAVSRALHVEVPVFGMRHWQPFFGLATAASGYIIAGALGWAIRIGFTLLFGKEAFGTGDIHLMAAAGAVAGWPVVVLGFVLTCVLALVGWLAALPFKRARALPLGPWLSLSILTVVVYYDPIIRSPYVARVVDMVRLLALRNSQFSGFESLR